MIPPRLEVKVEVKVEVKAEVELRQCSTLA